MSYPQMVKVRQKLYLAPLKDIPAALRQELERVGLRGLVRPGQRIAIGAGSRGIANYALILRTLVGELKELRAEPFLVPAMGSHGGATAQGQVTVLASLGVTEGYVGAPILSSMETLELGRTGDGFPVLMDRYAAQADGIVVVNRVKKHTDFRSDLESGLMKMIAIGLGKQRQAEAIHRYGARGLRELIPPVARVALAKAPFLLGLAIMEDGYGQTSRLVAIPAGQMEERERELLREAREHAAKLPFDEVDILIVEAIGKDISGSGMDTNVIGRLAIPGEEEFKEPRIEVIVALDLTEATHGNASGVGLADIITRRLLDKIDFPVTNMNTITSGFLERGKLPLVADTPEAALETALSLIRPTSPEEARVMRIRDTLHLEEMDISTPLAKEAQGREDITLLSEPFPLRLEN